VNDRSDCTEIPLFAHISPKEVQKMLDCFQNRVLNGKKGQLLFVNGTLLQEVGVVLTGSVRLENNDLWGNRSLIGIAEEGALFAESYTLLGDCPLLVDVVANEDCRVLMLKTEKLMNPCCRVCEGHVQLIKNMLLLSSRKNIALSERMLDSSPKSVRGRVMSYLSREVARQGCGRLVLPFDRQQMADYLNLDRSALSKELSRMKADGLLRYHKNVFEVL